MPSGSALLPDFTCQLGPKKESAMADHGESDSPSLNSGFDGTGSRLLLRLLGVDQINLLYKPLFSRR
jgi:hypothetical protein